MGNKTDFENGWRLGIGCFTGYRQYPVTSPCKTKYTFYLNTEDQSFKIRHFTYTFGSYVICKIRLSREKCSHSEIIFFNQEGCPCRRDRKVFPSKNFYIFWRTIFSAKIFLDRFQGFYCDDISSAILDA